MQESPPSILSPQAQGGPQPNNRWFPYRSAGDFDANLILILIILFSSLVLAVSLNAALRCYLRRCHRRRQLHSPRQPDVSKPPPPDTDTSLPTLSFSTSLQLAGAAAGVAAECAICLTEFLSGDQVRVLPKCNHGFHVKCIQLWLTSHASCPTCRTCCLSPAPEVAAAAQVERRSPETVAEP